MKKSREALLVSAQMAMVKHRTRPDPKKQGLTAPCLETGSPSLIPSSATHSLAVTLGKSPSLAKPQVPQLESGANTYRTVAKIKEKTHVEHFMLCMAHTS